MARTQLEMHEDICAERYEAINFRLTRLEKVILVAAAFVITSLFGIVGALALQVIQIGNLATKLS